MNSKYNLLSKSNKLIAWILAISIGLFFTVLVNTDYLQASMFGKWEVTENILDSDLTKKTEYVIISSYALTIGDETKIPIKYTSKSSNSSFQRVDVENNLYYYFKKDKADEYYSFVLVFNKSDTDRMELFELDHLNPDMPKSAFILERSE